jgi:small GTP-binding protein
MGLTQKTIILVGDAGCGKSALAIRLTHSVFSENYIPTGFESLTTDIETQGGNVKLILQDVSGAKERTHVRKLAYDGCDAVLLCFDVSSKTSYQNIETQWIPEISSARPGVPVFIAACKQDIAEEQTEDEKEEFKTEIGELVEKTGAVGYLECSASTNENVELIFHRLLEEKTQKQQSGVIKAIKSTRKSIKKLYKSI